MLSYYAFICADERAISETVVIVLIQMRDAITETDGLLLLLSYTDGYWYR